MSSFIVVAIGAVDVDVDISDQGEEEAVMVRMEMTGSR